MKNDFLDDDWLKEELADEYISDDDFSFSVIKKIQANESESKSKRNFYAILTAMIAIISFLFIPDLMTLSAEGAAGSASFALLDLVSEQQKSPFMQIEFIGLCVICLSFILIWSFEDFDLI
jgi:hypothetical protein